MHHMNVKHIHVQDGVHMWMHTTIRIILTGKSYDIVFSRSGIITLYIAAHHLNCVLLTMHTNSLCYVRFHISSS